MADDGPNTYQGSMESGSDFAANSDDLYPVVQEEFANYEAQDEENEAPQNALDGHVQAEGPADEEEILEDEHGRAVRHITAAGPAKPGAKALEAGKQVGVAHAERPADGFEIAA